MSRLAFCPRNVQGLTIPPRKQRTLGTRTAAAADGTGGSARPSYDRALFVFHDGRWFSYDHVDVCDRCMLLYETENDEPHTCPS